MSEATVRAQIVTRLQAVSTVPDATVYGYMPWVNTWSNFIEKFKDPASAQLHGWTVRRVSETRIRDAAQHELRRYVFRVEGWYGLSGDGSSEITWQAIIDDVFNELEEYLTLSNTVELMQPLTLDILDHHALEGHLSHHAVITIIAEERVRVIPT